MAFYENLVIFAGRAVRDAESKQVNDSTVTTVRLAYNEKVKRRNGDTIEKNVFIDVDLWGKKAEYAANYVRKGKFVRIVGKLEQDEWTTNNGENRQKHKIYAETVQVERSDDGNQQQTQQRQSQDRQHSSKRHYGDNADDGGNENNLPF